MKPLTYVEAIKEILIKRDVPMKAKDLIRAFNELGPYNVSPYTIRQTIYKAALCRVLVKIKISGYPSFYSLPSWSNGTFLKEKYKQKIYAGKQIRIQKPTGSLGRIA